MLSGIKDKLLSPDLIEVFVREFTADWNARVASRRQSTSALEGELAGVERRLHQIVAAIEQGIITATTKDRLLELEARRDTLTTDIAKTASSATPPALHPGLAALYRRKVAELETALGTSRKLYGCVICSLGKSERKSTRCLPKRAAAWSSR